MDWIYNFGVSRYFSLDFRFVLSYCSCKINKNSQKNYWDQKRSKRLDVKIKVLTVVEFFLSFFIISVIFLSVLPTIFSKLKKKTKKMCFTDFPVWPKEMNLLCGWIACSRDILYSCGVSWLILNYFLTIYFVFCIFNFPTESRKCRLKKCIQWNSYNCLNSSH